MADPVRLVTNVELERADGPEVSFSAVLVAVLSDGRRVTLLDDRGWTSRRSDGLPEQLDRGDIEETARMVVGPDEAFGEHPQAHMEGTHWAYLAGILRAHGVFTGGEVLRALPHDVVFGERALAALRAQG